MIRKKWLFEASLLLIDIVRIEISPTFTVVGDNETLVTSRVGGGGVRKVFKLSEKAITITKARTIVNIALKLGISFTYTRLCVSMRLTFSIKRLFKRL